MHNNERVIIYQYHGDTGHGPHHRSGQDHDHHDHDGQVDVQVLPGPSLARGTPSRGHYTLPSQVPVPDLSLLILFINRLEAPLTTLTAQS